MTFPRTTASALLSPASRSPSRLWNASSTASFTSFVSAGSAVWLSKGRIATVLMLGRPPPAKPYRQPPSATASALTPFRLRVRAQYVTQARRVGTGLPAPAPNRRIQHRGRIDQDHRTGDDGGATRPESPRPPVIEPQRIRRRKARLTAPAPALLVVLILPPESDRGVARRQRGPTPGNGGVPIHRGQRLRHQRRGLARAAGQQRTGANVGECYPRVKRKTLRSQ